MKNLKYFVAEIKVLLFFLFYLCKCGLHFASSEIIVQFKNK